MLKKNSTTIAYNDDTFDKLPEIPLLGNHQKENISLAIKAAHHLIDIKINDIIKGIQNIYWPGRNQIINRNPTIIFDVAHNESSLIEFCKSMELLNIKGEKILLISIQKTKKIKNATYNLIDYFDKIICISINDRMYTTTNLNNLFNQSKNVKTSDNPNHIINKIVKNLKRDDLFAIVGSHYWGAFIEKSFKNSFVS